MFHEKYCFFCNIHEKKKKLQLLIGLMTIFSLSRMHMLNQNDCLKGFTQLELLVTAPRLIISNQTKHFCFGNYGN